MMETPPETPLKLRMTFLLPVIYTTLLGFAFGGAGETLGTIVLWGSMPLGLIGIALGSTSSGEHSMFVTGWTAMFMGVVQWSLIGLIVDALLRRRKRRR